MNDYNLYNYYDIDSISCSLKPRKYGIYGSCKGPLMNLSKHLDHGTLGLTRHANNFVLNKCEDKIVTFLVLYVSDI